MEFSFIPVYNTQILSRNPIFNEVPKNLTTEISEVRISPCTSHKRIIKLLGCTKDIHVHVSEMLHQ